MAARGGAQTGEDVLVREEEGLERADGAGLIAEEEVAVIEVGLPEGGFAEAIVARVLGIAVEGGVPVGGVEEVGAVHDLGGAEGKLESFRAGRGWRVQGAYQ